VTDIARALIDDLDDDTLDHLAELLAPRILARFEPAPVEPADLLTCAEAAAQAHVHVETIRRAARSGALPAARAGRTVRIAPADLSAWLQDAQTPVSVSRPRARRSKGGRTLADALAAGNQR